MLAWKKWGNGETPESSGMKGDHLVGKYYVKFEQENIKAALDYLKHIISKNQYIDTRTSKIPQSLLDTLIIRIIDSNILEKQNISFKEIMSNKSIIYNEVEQNLITEFLKDNNFLMFDIREMLLKWEAGDKETRELWEMMNSWVYKGFEATYKMLGVDFDKTYYESNTYLSGKNIVEEGLKNGVLKRRADNSVYIDLTADGLDEKTLLRADGTSVYMTQDLGTAVQRAEEEHFSKIIYTVGNEQDYHFKVLFLILKKLDYQWANGLYHLSYGMVELPEGKMKSREGTVVDADDLMKEMIETAAATTKELGKAQDLTEAESEKLYRTIGLGALKYFMLKIDPKKKMLFNPAESIDFNGNTAPFIQFNYVRIQALLRKAKEDYFDILDSVAEISFTDLLPKEKKLIILLYDFNSTLNQAATEYSPAIIANYVYDLAKEFSQYYHDTPIFKEEQKDLILFRLQLSKTIGIAIKSSMQLLGIEVPERM